MSEETIIRHCAPTLAGIKTGNLFRCAYPDRREMIEDVRRWNTALSPKGLRLIPLQYDKGSAMIYLFRPARLQADLNDHMACALLQARGYATQTCSRCIVGLIDRLRQSAEFPHEIGLFLGYPPEDVSGFMEHRDTGCKCVGFWKVYGDETTARKTFARYRKCSAAYYRQWKKGQPLRPADHHKLISPRFCSPPLLIQAKGPPPGSFFAFCIPKTLLKERGSE